MALATPIIEFARTGVAPAVMQNKLGSPWWFVLFAAIFVAGDVLLISGVVLSFFGSVEVRINGTECLISSGLGPVRRKWRVSLAQIAEVVVVNDRYGKGGRLGYISVRADKVVKFGGYMAQCRREFLAAALRTEAAAAYEMCHDRTRVDTDGESVGGMD